MTLTKYAANTSWLIGEKIVRICAGFLVSVALIRYLGPDKLGMLAFSQSYTALFAVLSTLGLESIVIHDLVRDPENQNKILGTAFCLKVLGVLLMLATIGVSFAFIEVNNTTKLMIMMMWASQLLLSFNIIEIYFKARVIGKKIALVNSLAFGISSISKIILITKEAHVTLFAAVSMLDAVVIALGLIYLYVNHGEYIENWKPDKELAKNMLRRSFPLLISILLTTITLQLDQVIIKVFLNTEDVGLYAASLRLTQLFYFIPVVLTTSFFPKLIEIKTTSRYKSRLKSFNSLLTFTAITIAAFLTFSRGLIINDLLGNEFNRSSTLILYHAISMIFVFNFSLRKKLLILNNEENYIVIYSAATAVLMAVLLLSLVPLFGLTGAALAHLGSWGISIMFVPLVLGRKQELGLFIQSLNPLLISNAFKKIN